MTILPQDFARRSFLYRELESAGATFDEVNGAAIAMAFGDDAAAEAAQARSLGLSDLSVLPRTGYKGWNMATWLQGQGAEMAEQNNNVSPQADGTRIARLAPGEALLLGDDQGSAGLIEKMDGAWSMETADGCFQVPRAETNFWLALSGAETPALFAKICAVDLRPAAAPPHTVVQTNVARLNAIIIRRDTAEVPVFDLLSDIASAVYLWRALLDAMDEFGGKPIGLTALRTLK
ncbi:MAG: sarcosine oxidase [Rhodospirillaceae bacterium]|jgi:sarcosine oxidase, subunit gamma|nr:sarcosine oxidase [Rhodospirillaceae bacterium]MBT6829755.1 sarcosine oxidase [Rhodospirillaceae bacterium]